MKNVLGYINHFVEHQGLKVIIIANESKIEDEDKYQGIKEKLIGKTFDIDLDFESAFQNFLSIASNLHVKNFLSKNLGLICNEYEEHKYKNLRTLRQIILDFERIYGELPEKARKEAGLLQDILRGARHPLARELRLSWLFR
ncbi:MAG: P-loop NTPase fold protein, partial [Thainema sp.]